MRRQAGAAGAEKNRDETFPDGHRREALSLGAQSRFSNYWSKMKIGRDGGYKGCRHRTLKLRQNHWCRRPRTRIAFREAFGSMLLASFRNRSSRIRDTCRHGAESVTGLTMPQAGGLRRNWNFLPLPSIRGLSRAGKSRRQSIAPIQTILLVRHACVVGYRHLPSVRPHRAAFWSGLRCRCHVREQSVLRVGHCRHPTVRNERLLCSSLHSQK
jgi:hypothetical protein